MRNHRNYLHLTLGLAVLLAAPGARAGEQPDKTKGPSFEACWNDTQDPNKPALDKLTCWTEYLKASKARTSEAGKQAKALKKDARDAVISLATETAADSSRPAADRLSELNTLGKALSKPDARKFILPLYKKVKQEQAEAALGELVPAVTEAKAKTKAKAPADEQIAAWTTVAELAKGNKKARKYAMAAKAALKKLHDGRLRDAIKAATKIDRDKKADIPAKLAAWQVLSDTAEGHPNKAKAKVIKKKAAAKAKAWRKKLWNKVDKLDTRSDVPSAQKIAAWTAAQPHFAEDSEEGRYAMKRLAELAGTGTPEPEAKAGGEKKPEAKPAETTPKPEAKATVAKPRPDEPKPGLAIGVSAPRFTLRTMNQDRSGMPLVNLEHHVGKAAKKAKKAVLLSFFADYCQPCKEELPVLNKLAREFGGKGLLVVSVCIDKKKPAIDSVKKLVSKGGFDFPVLLDRLNIVARRYNIKRLPAVYFIGPDGKVAAARVGYGEDGEAYIRGQVRSMLGLGDPPVTPNPKAKAEPKPEAKPAPVTSKPKAKAEPKPADDDDDQDEDDDEDDDDDDDDDED